MMLKDELKLLQEFASALVSGIVDGSLTTSYLNEIEVRIAAESQRIKKMWSDLLFSQTKDYVIKRYIWFQQQTLLDLADKVHYSINYNSQLSLQSNNEMLSRSLASLLERLLELNHFLIHYFNTYINEDVKIPDASIPKARKKMCEAAEQVSAILQTAALDQQLKACILDYLDVISTTHIGASVTYRSWEYLISFTESLGVTIKFEDDRDLTHSITEALFYLNFNHHNFCQWYQEDIISKTIILGTTDQLPMLKKQLLVLKTMPVILTMCYDPDILPINVLLEKWLNEYIKEKHIHFDLLEMDFTNKIELKLTVAQLALLIRLLYEEGIFAMKNIAGLLRFFSRHFMSKKQEHISYGSMNKLYYSGDQFTGYAVRELLLRMIAKINKMFFPT
jgi:hypothetical protein